MASKCLATRGIDLAFSLVSVPSLSLSAALKRSTPRSCAGDQGAGGEGLEHGNLTGCWDIVMTGGQGQG